MLHNSNNSIKNWVVLIVDDDVDNLNVAEKILTFYGAQVHTADNGRSGLEKLQEIGKPNTILLDLSMPDMDGWEMLKKIREDKELSSLPVIAVTAHAMPEDKERAEKAGFDGYIAKPFILDTLIDVIRKCLKNKISQDTTQKLGDKL